MNWWQYLLLVNIYLLLFYGFYALLFSKETFFRLNRIYLVGSAILSFVVPLIQTDWVQNLFITQKINQTIYQLDGITITANPQQAETGVSVGQILGVVYITGMVVLLIRLVIQLSKLRRVLNDQDTGTAFSFFGKVTISPELAEQDVIAAHENVHAKQWHSADVLLMELIAIINWFNPVVYLYRKAIKHIHEFIADSEIINKGAAKQDYAMLLLSQTFNTPVNQLANSFFNHSLLKQRIMMLHKNPSQRKALLKYGLCAPLFALMIILSSATTRTNNLVTKAAKKADEILSTKPVAFNKIVENQSAAVAPSVSLQQAVKVDKKLSVKPDTTKDKVYFSVSQSAIPPGGFEGFYRFLGNNIHYPDAARKNKVQGRVICQFIVEKDGSLSNLKVIRGIGSGCDEEAIRVLATIPNWTPGKQDGKVVRQQYVVPIQFALQDAATSSTNNGMGKNDKGQASVKNSSAITDIILDTAKDPNMVNRDVPKNVEYYINDVLVSKDSLDHLPASKIESMMVLKATPGVAGSKNQIKIKTKN